MRYISLSWISHRAHHFESTLHRKGRLNPPTQYPKIVALFHGQSHYKWMMTRGTPISGSSHMWIYVPMNLLCTRDIGYNHKQRRRFKWLVEMYKHWGWRIVSLPTVVAAHNNKEWHDTSREETPLPGYLGRTFQESKCLESFRIPIFMDQSPWPCLNLKFWFVMLESCLISLCLVVRSPRSLCGHLELCTAGVLRHDLRDGAYSAPGTTDVRWLQLECETCTIYGKWFEKWWIW